MAFEDVGQSVKTALGFPNQRIVAGSGAAGADQFGAAFNRQDYLSMVAAIACVASLAGVGTVAVDLGVQDSADGSTGWADVLPTLGGGQAETTALGVEGTGAAFPSSRNANRATVTYTGGGVVSGHEALNVNLDGAKQYLRFVVRTVFSAGSVDYVDVAGIGVFGEARVEPV